MHSPFTEFLLAFVTRMDAAIARRGCRGMAYGFRAKLPTPGGGQDDLQIHFINFEQQVGSAIDADELAQLADIAKSYGLRITPGSLSGTYAVTLRTQPSPVIQRQAGLRTEDMLRPADQRDVWKKDDELTQAKAATNPDVEQAEHCHEVATDELPARGKPKKSKCSPAAWQAYRKRVLAGEDEKSEVMSLELVAVKVDMSERTILRILEDPSSKLKRFGGTAKRPGLGRVLITRKSYTECFGQTGK